ncbi:MAG: oligosaccharide flippase family protein [Thermoplasmata archaeon]
MDKSKLNDKNIGDLRDKKEKLPLDPENIPRYIPDIFGNLPYFMQIRRFLGASLYKNAFFLMLNSSTTALLGFIAWIVISNTFDKEQVGLGSAIISATSLISTLSLLGFSVSIVRFLPSATDRRLIINSSMTISTAAAFVISIGFIAGLSWLSPSLLFLQKNYAYSAWVVIYVIGWTASMLLDCVFIGLRKASIVFLKNFIYSVIKIPLPLFFIQLGAIGILFSWGISAYTALFIGFAVYLYRIVGIRFPKPMIDRETIGEMFHFSIANYIAGLLGQATPLLLPILIINTLGAESTAYYYISWMIATALFMIPGSVSSSLLAECSQEPKKMRLHTIKAFKFTYMLLIPSVFLVCIFASYILSIFGRGYSEGAENIVRILAFSSLIYGANLIFVSARNVERKVISVILLNLISTIFTFLMGYALMLRMGLSGVAFGWLIGQCFGLIYAIADHTYSAHINKKNTKNKKSKCQKDC